MGEQANMIRIEFYGIPRQRAGVAETTIETPAAACSLGELLELLCRRFPRLEGDCFERRNLRRTCLASLDGERFISDPRSLIPAGHALLLMSADVGG